MPSGGPPRLSAAQVEETVVRAAHATRDQRHLGPRQDPDDSFD